MITETTYRFKHAAPRAVVTPDASSSLRRWVCAALLMALCALSGCRKNTPDQPVVPGVHHTATLRLDPGIGNTTRLWFYNSDDALVQELSSVVATEQLTLPAGRYRVVAATDDDKSYTWSGAESFSLLRMHLRQSPVEPLAAATRASREPVAAPAPFATVLCELDLTGGDATLPVTLEERLKQLRLELTAEPDPSGRIPRECEIQLSGLSATFCLSHHRPMPGDDIRHAAALAPVTGDPFVFTGIMPLMGNDSQNTSILTMTVHYGDGWKRTATLVVDEQMEALDEAQKINIAVGFPSDPAFSAVITDWEVVTGEFPVH